MRESERERKRERERERERERVRERVREAKDAIKCFSLSSLSPCFLFGDHQKKKKNVRPRLEIIRLLFRARPRLCVTLRGEGKSNIEALLFSSLFSGKILVPPMQPGWTNVSCMKSRSYAAGAMHGTLPIFEENY